jgi:phosphoserine phosphatase
MYAIERLTSTEDIAVARAEMVSWYRHHDMSTLLRLVQTVTFAPGAREGIAALRRSGVRVALVSITWQFALDWLATDLGVDFAVGTRWCEDGTIAHFWPDDKAMWLAHSAAKFGLLRAEIAAVGDSAGDVPMLSYAGIGYFVGRDKPDLPEHVRHWPAGNIAEIVHDMVPDLPSCES